MICGFFSTIGLVYVLVKDNLKETNVKKVDH